MSKSEYMRWVAKELSDPDLKEELEKMADKDDAIEDAFYRNLEFGTGGLRGVIGAGTNRMNVYTVAKASQGLANYVCSHFEKEHRKIAVSYDSRIKSELFAKVACQVFAANGIKTFIYKELMPTPCLSYAVRALKCAAGIMVTASHNPGKYNGYKVYGSDGCQITTGAADLILTEIEKVDIFDDVTYISFEEGLEKDIISYIPDQIYDDFTEAVKALSLEKDSKDIKRDVEIVYSPLNGTGLKPVLRALKDLGYTNIHVVKEQEFPDGTFPTCPYPNPEMKEAMALGIDYAKKYNAELLLATDPDCDRVGIAVKDGVDYLLLSGNETGCLLLDYICKRRLEQGTMPTHPMMVKTIVTTDLGERIAKSYGLETVNVLTGFKFIGEQIGFLENKGRIDDYVFGFEESYGYLSGSHARDKDAVNAAVLICEMFAYYKSKGITLIQKLQELYDRFGYSKNSLYSFEFEGAKGAEIMKAVMEKFRLCQTHLAGKVIERKLDYAAGLDGLPKSNVLKFYLEGDVSLVVRPSGTEPKMKIYLSVMAENEKEADDVTFAIMEDIRRDFALK